MNQLGKSISGSFALKLFVLFVPFFLCEQTIETWLEYRQNRETEIFSNKTKALVEQSALETDPEYFVSRVVWAIFARVRKNFQASPDNPRKWAQLLPPSQVKIDTFLFDKRGKLISSGNLPNQWVITNLYNGLTATSEEEQIKISNKLKGLLNTTFGQGKNLAYFKSLQGKVCRVFHQKKLAWAAWEKMEEGGVFLFCRERPLEEDCFKRFVEKKNDELYLLKKRGNGSSLHKKRDSSHSFGMTNNAVISSKGRNLFYQEPLGYPELVRRNDEFIWGFGVHGKKWITSRPKAETINQTVENLWRELEKNGQWQISYQGRLWCFCRTKNGRVHFVGRTLSSSYSPNAILRGLALTAWLICATILGAVRTQLSIRYSIALLFSLSALIPVTAILFGSYFFLHGRKQVLANQVLRIELETLKNIEDEYAHYLSTVRDQLQIVLSDPRIAALEKDFESFLRHDSLRKFDPKIELLNGSGEILFSTLSKQEVFMGTMQNFYRLALKLWAPAKLVKSKNSSQEEIDNFFSKEELGFQFMAFRPRSLHPVSTSGSRSIFFWNFFPSPRHPGAFIYAIIKEDMLVGNYLRQKLFRLPSLFDREVIIGAMDTSSGAWINSRIKSPEKLRNIVLRAPLLNRPLNGMIKLGGLSYYFTVYPADNLGRYCLLALFPEDTLKDNLADLLGKIILGLITMFGAGGVLAMTVSWRLLLPIFQISRGVKALETRDFRYRLPELGETELGELGTAFNEMMTEIRELDVARAVQEGLIPKSFPKTSEYSMFGQVRFASELGGDCLECRLLKNGNFFFLVGDVSGHGVASALLMAYLRATVTIWANNPDPDPICLGSQVEKLFHALEGKGTFLATCYGVYNPVEHRGTMAFCGHPYPILCRKSGEFEFFGMPSYPLGSRKRMGKLQSKSFELKNGDGLFLYTDGLIESRNSAGEMFGYSGLQSWMGNNFVQEPKAWMEKLTAFHSNSFPDRDDDITVFSITRSIKDATGAEKS